MDPLTAVGVAANIVQFVSFTSGLISKTREISCSPTGSCAEIVTLQSSYEHLQRLSSKLGRPPVSRSDLIKDDSTFPATPAHPDNIPEYWKECAEFGDTNPIVKYWSASKTLADHYSAIKELWLACQTDCENLLGVLQKLISANKPNSKWRSFKIALSTMWKANKISELEERLHRTQSNLTLHLCATISHWQVAQQRQFEILRLEGQKLRCEQWEKLTEIKAILDRIQTRTTDASPLRPADITSLEKDMNQLSLSEFDIATEQEILKSLSFESRPTRLSAIPDAHQQTFRWAFKNAREGKGGQSAHNLWKWLKTQNGFFWVSGKPGSGKSTFMKFISNYSATKDALKEWAYPKPAIIAAHYFWSAGTLMQRSQQGLLQSLLFDIFRQVPSLARISSPDRWDKTTNRMQSESWSTKELSGALQKIADQDTLPVRFCFFIDGLDEYEGDHLDFCTVLLNLSQSPNIKLCMSSRPWNVFEDSFGKHITSKMYVHEWTKDDIRQYVTSRLHGHPKWNELYIDPIDAKWLTEEITDRASGVFLWVFLVTKQLRNGLAEYDSFSDLRRRLESIPTDLEGFFKDILNSVEPFYHARMATTLQISLAAREPMSTAIYSFHDEEYDDNDYALKLPFQPFETDKFNMRQLHTTRRLNGRCKGLLEVNSASGCVEFLHRTVMDFLRTREMFHFLVDKSPGWFNSNLSLLGAITAHLKTSNIPTTFRRIDFADINDVHLNALVNEALMHASLLDDPGVAFAYLDQLDRWLPEASRKHADAFGSVSIDPGSKSLYFREMVLSAAMTPYLRHTIPRQPNYFSDFQVSPLWWVVNLCRQCSGPSDTAARVKRLETLSCLLEHGQDPNKTYRRAYNLPCTTTWKFVLGRFLSEESEWMLENGLLRLMIQHGADPNAQMDHYTTAWMNILLFFPNIPPASPLHIPYLQVLDDLINAGAKIHLPSHYTGLDSDINVGQSFLDTLCKHLQSPSAPINWPLLTTITGKIFSMVEPAQLDVLVQGFPDIRKEFPDAAFNRLLRQYRIVKDGDRNADSSPSFNKAKKRNNKEVEVECKVRRRNNKKRRNEEVQVKSQTKKKK